jgi:hypothetical protein
MNHPITTKGYILQVLILIVWCVLFASAIILFTGCSTLPSSGQGQQGVSGFVQRVLGGGQEAAPAQDPIARSVAVFTSVGIILAIVGLFLTVKSGMSTGWGIDLLLTGVCMIFLAWVFQIWWVPWLALILVGVYAIYHYNIFKPKTNPFLPSERPNGND